MCRILWNLLSQRSLSADLQCSACKAKPVVTAEPTSKRKKFALVKVTALDPQCWNRRNCKNHLHCPLKCMRFQYLTHRFQEKHKSKLKIKAYHAVVRDGFPECSGNVTDIPSIKRSPHFKLKCTCPTQLFNCRNVSLNAICELSGRTNDLVLPAAGPLLWQQRGLDN